MSSHAYYLVSLCAALLLIAVVSGLVERHMRRAQRRLQAVALLDALGRSTDWMAAQGRAVCFQQATQPSEPALAATRPAQRRWFPELDGAAEALLAVHRRVAELLRMHEALHAGDPEAWLDGAHDAAFMDLWREHCAIVRAMERRLLAVASTSGMLRPHGFPA